MNGVVAMVSGAGVLGALAGIAVVDAKRMVIRLDLVAVLMLAGLCWLFGGGGMERLGTEWSLHLAGAALGAGLPMALILGAEAFGRRWPIYPGDALLLCAVGGLLGLRWFLWVTVLGSCVAVLQRICVQTRRGRPLNAGYLPAGPGLAVGAAVVFVAVNAGVAFAAQDAEGSGEYRVQIVATELLPAKPLLPEELAAKEVVLDGEAPLPFPALVAALGRVGGVEVVVEERPSRVAGGGAELPLPEPLGPGEERVFGRVVEDIAARAGYGWEWRDGRLVFYRYWDSDWPGAPAVRTAESGVKKDPFERVLSWLGRLLGGDKADEDQRDVEARDAEVAQASAPAAGGEEAGAGLSAPERGSGDAGVGDAPSREGTKETRSATGSSVGQVPAEKAMEEPPELERWEVDPAAQATLRAVVESWADKAEWNVDWRSRKDFSIAAGAVFEGGFLKAIDRLFSDPQVSRVLLVSAHANRYLVIRDADG